MNTGWLYRDEQLFKVKKNTFFHKEGAFLIITNFLLIALVTKPSNNAYNTRLHGGGTS